MTQSVAQLMLRALQAADIAGLRAVVVHAKNQSARAFYLKYGFEPSPTDDLHLMLLYVQTERPVLSLHNHCAKKEIDTLFAHP